MTTVVAQVESLVALWSLTVLGAYFIFRVCEIMTAGTSWFFGYILSRIVSEQERRCQQYGCDNCGDWFSHGAVGDYLFFRNIGDTIFTSLMAKKAYSAKLSAPVSLEKSDDEPPKSGVRSRMLSI